MTRDETDQERAIRAHLDELTADAGRVRRMYLRALWRELAEAEGRAKDIRVAIRVLSTLELGDR